MRLEVWFDKISEMAKLLCNGELEVSQSLRATVGVPRSESTGGECQLGKHRMYIKITVFDLVLCFHLVCRGPRVHQSNYSFNTLALLFIVDLNEYPTATFSRALLQK